MLYEVSQSSTRAQLAELLSSLKSLPRGRDTSNTLATVYNRLLKTSIARSNLVVLGLEGR